MPFLQEKVRKIPEKFQLSPQARPPFPLLSGKQCQVSFVDEMGDQASSEIGKQESKSKEPPLTVPLAFFRGCWKPQARQGLDRI